MIVLDASVAAKWFLPESGGSAAHRLLTGGDRFIAPALIQIEVTGAILRCFREEKIDQPRAQHARTAWDEMLADELVQLLPNEELYESAVKIAFECRHNIQDCLYVAAAKAVDAELVTADETLVKRGRKCWKRIRLLETAGDA